MQQLHREDVRLPQVPLEFQQLIGSGFRSSVVWSRNVLQITVDVAKRAGIHEPEFVLRHGAGKQQPWREIGDSFLAEIEAWNEVRYVKAVLIADKLAVYVDDTARTLAEFSGVICHIQIDALDRIDRNVGTQTARRYIREIQPIHLISDLIGAGTVDMNLVIVVADDGRVERNCIQEILPPVYGRA